MLIRFLILFLFVLFSKFACSQENKIISNEYIRDIRKKYKSFEISGDYKVCIDSLNSFLSIENHKIKRAFLFRELGSKYYSWNKLDSSKLYFNKALSLFNDSKYYINEINKIKFSLGNIYTNKKELEKAMQIYLDVLDHFQKQRDTTLVITIYENIGSVLSKNGNQKDAERYFLNGLNYSLRKNDFKSMASAYNHLSELYLNKQSNEIAKSIEYGILALDAAKKSKSVKHINTITANLGSYYSYQGNFEKAKHYLRIAEAEYTKKGDYSVNIYKILARIYTYEMNSDSAKYYLKKIDYKKLTNTEQTHFDNLNWALENGNVGMQYFVSLDKYKLKYDSMVRAKVNTQASELEKKYNLLEKENQIKKLNEINLLNKIKSQNLEVSFFKQSNENEKLSKEKLFIENTLKDKSIVESNNKLEIFRLNTEKKIAEIKLLEQQKTIFGSGIGLILISFLSLLIFRQSRNRRLFNDTLTKQKDQIQLLHQELNHRVKNNLSFMTSLVEMQGRRTQNIEAREILQETENRLGALSLVHSNLFKNDEATTVNLAFYLEELVSQLEKIFAIPGKELNVICDLTDHHVNAEDAMRLGLIVNELVTNSIKHAFTDVNDPQINIATKLDKAGKLTLEYKDNGPGHTHVSNLAADETNAHLGTKLIALLREQMKDRYTLVC